MVVTNGPGSIKFKETMGDSICGDKFFLLLLESLNPCMWFGMV
jgi:hypothetical protein